MIILDTSLNKTPSIITVNLLLLKRKRQRGIHLIDLMIVLVIIGIFTLFAIPSFANHPTKTKVKVSEGIVFSELKNSPN
jgi:Tfp pilus assembly protein FimT